MISRRWALLAAVIATSAAAPASADKPTLTIYTYSSFVSEWGPGPALQPLFEAQCGCSINWVSLEDGAALLSRLKLEGVQTEADIVLGLDTNLTAETAATGLIAPHEADLSALTLPIAWDDANFVPYDYGYFAVVYDSQILPNPPQSLAELTAPGDGPKIILMDPRTSTPGLGLLLWVKQVAGDGAAEAWTNLAKKTLTVTKGWSEAYGLFLKGEAPMVLSYTTSPAYHVMMESTDRYKAAEFAEGNYLQVEVAARLKTSDQPELAKLFLAFLTSRAAQEKLPTTNWMYPVIDLGDALPQAFRDLKVPAKALLMPSDQVAANRSAWIEEWLNSAGQ
ncbi:MAG: thiamine ABC transporter substrate binding subunit [Rhodospirillaceae bacterium]|nr:thiamine ABC transporter substrate binding subunit [Rhodospirillaceae bacterium]